MQNKRKRVHLIAIGGAVMHNLALALHRAGWAVSGSDDEIFEPSKGRLQKAGLLPPHHGWFPGQLSGELDLVILGMHAKNDNPELARAQELGLKVVSFPEFFALNSKKKRRIAIAGSHGKTTTTSMVLHVLRQASVKTSFLVGSMVEGFDLMVNVDEDTENLIVEADEYLSSPIDSRPKFLWYTPHISVITGMAWDHINAFKTEVIYKDQFREFIRHHESGATIFYDQTDAALVGLINEFGARFDFIPYGPHPYSVSNGRTIINTPIGPISMEVFGTHNMSNLNAALHVCRMLGVSFEVFYRAIATFRGARSRLEKIWDSAHLTVLRDFAHAPSKVRASVAAVKEQFQGRKIITCLELHTFSSLNAEFLPQYEGSLSPADQALVFFDPNVVELKRLTPLTSEMIRSGFDRSDTAVVNSRSAVEKWISEVVNEPTVILMMSSGSWGGLDIPQLGKSLEASLARHN